MSDNSIIPLTRATLKSVLRAAAKASGQTVEELCGPGRQEPLVIWRQAAMAVARKRVYQMDGAPVSYPAIGNAFGKRDHTTVIYACRKVEDDGCPRTARHRGEFQQDCVRLIEQELNAMLGIREVPYDRGT